MLIEKFINIINSDFYTGVPDSQLKALCNYLMAKYGIDKNHHIIAANEGNCTALAAGYYLATGKVPVVYMQNSGEGNIINPVASLLNEKVYAIPTIFIIGWRGEPGVKDEPQHIYQGEITLKLLDDMDIAYCVLSKTSTEKEVSDAMETFRSNLGHGRSVAFVIKKDALEYDKDIKYSNTNLMDRENVIRHIVSVSKGDPIISTTGKASRELFEIREANKQSHKYDFLTVGSMGHCSSIALGVALNTTTNKVWCIDGDGAALMHLGAIPVIGANSPCNLIHILINNEAHETVGGMPTVASKIDWIALVKACGYTNAVSVNDYEALDAALKSAKEKDSLSFIEVKCSIGSRSDLGRPTTTAIENKYSFMKFLEEVR